MKDRGRHTATIYAGNLDMVALLTVEIMQLPHAQGLDLPKYQTEHASGIDLHAAVEGDVSIEPGAWKLIPTGIAVAIPEGYEGQVRPRSGLALRHGIGMLNSPGTIDADYRGEISVILFNFGKERFIIRRGDRIAQMVFARVTRAELRPVDRLDDTRRGSGGFGHTGI